MWGNKPSAALRSALMHPETRPKELNSPAGYLCSLGASWSLPEEQTALDFALRLVAAGVLAGPCAQPCPWLSGAGCSERAARVPALKEPLLPTVRQGASGSLQFRCRPEDL